MRIATSAYALINRLQHGIKHASHSVRRDWRRWATKQGEGRKWVWGCRAGAAKKGTERWRCQAAGASYVFSFLLWCGKEYFGVLWHDVIFALCVLLCGVRYAVAVAMSGAGSVSSPCSLVRRPTSTTTLRTSELLAR